LWTVKLQFQLGFVLVADSRQSNWTISYAVQSAACALLIFEFTNVNFGLLPVVLFYTFVMNWIKFLHADGDLLLHLAT